ncbi:ferrous iron transport protein B [Streptomyces sp. F63]|uniref:ferrous iron transport protein B n=1 Tax=Streptomyces sp. F63 TaxID=2824887 RepID=UPI001B379C0F|nr:ferrous iron transport protein B [Streptomyces sp. F63]MBQ0988330.1 ferrous iron transport protein B [Streptomyces sp. F63]
MKPCCDAHDAAPAPDGEEAAGDGRRLRVVLVGNPNTGKSTLFNALTGARQKVGNWPGKTVEVASGTWRPEGREAGGAGEYGISVTDLPGTYSLVPVSPDEELTRDLLVSAGAAERPDVVVAVLDAANLARNLYLCAQLSDTGIPLVVALTMTDIAAQRGLRIDAAALAAGIGAPVVPVSAREGTGLPELAAAVEQVHRRRAAPPPAALGEPAESAVRDLLRALARQAPGERRPARWIALRLLAGAPVPGIPGEVTALAARLAERLTAGARAAAAGGRTGEAAGDRSGDGGTRTGTGAHDRGNEPEDAGETYDEAAHDEDWDVETLLAEGRYAWVHQLMAAAVHRGGGTAGAARGTRSDRADRVLTSRIFGLPVFLAAMWAVFQSTTTLAAPLQSGLSDFFAGPVAAFAVRVTGDPDGSPLAGLVVHGIVPGVGQLLSFAPLIVIMFVLLGLLEDSGYMARAAFLVDRLMRTIGLPGKAFLPIIVGFGCNVPALSAARILGDRRQRLLLGMVLPLVTCSARLTVYILIAGVFFGSSAGTVVFLLYVLSVLLVVGAGLLLRPLLFGRARADALVLELPPYRLPVPRVVAAQAGQKLAAFLKTAGGVIVATVAAVWLLSSVPLGAARGGTGADADGAGAGFGRVAVEDSAFGGVSRAVAPVFAPAGFGDWHAAAALIPGFVAKEAVVSTMAQTYGTEEPDDGRRPGTLGEELRRTFDRSSGGHGTAAALAFMVFLLAYTPCVATVAAQSSVIGRRLTLWSMATMMAMAWLLAVAVFQVGRLVA